MLAKNFGYTTDTRVNRYVSANTCLQAGVISLSNLSERVTIAQVGLCGCALCSVGKQETLDRVNQSGAELLDA